MAGDNDYYDYYRRAVDSGNRLINAGGYYLNQPIPYATNLINRGLDVTGSRLAPVYDKLLDAGANTTVNVARNLARGANRGTDYLGSKFSGYLRNKLLGPYDPTKKVGNPPFSDDIPIVNPYQAPLQQDDILNQAAQAYQELQQQQAPPPPGLFRQDEGLLPIGAHIGGNPVTSSPDLGPLDTADLLNLASAPTPNIDQSLLFGPRPTQQVRRRGTTPNRHAVHQRRRLPNVPPRQPAQPRMLPVIPNTPPPPNYIRVDQSLLLQSGINRAGLIFPVDNILRRLIFWDSQEWNNGVEPDAAVYLTSVMESITADILYYVGRINAAHVTPQILLQITNDPELNNLYQTIIKHKIQMKDHNYFSPIFIIFKQYYAQKNITQKAISLLNTFINDVFVAIAVKLFPPKNPKQPFSLWSTVFGYKDLTPDPTIRPATEPISGYNVQNAVKALLTPGPILNDIIYDATIAVYKYENIDTSAIERQ